MAKFIDLDGLAYTYGKIKALIASSVAGKAEKTHTHAAGDITSGTLPVGRGGTGNTSVDTAPTSGSTKMVTSGGVFTALADKAGKTAATQSAAGLMSAADKKKLDGVATGANAYSLPSATGSVVGGVKLSDSTAGTEDASSGVAATPKAVKSAYSMAYTAYNTVNDLNDSLSDNYAAKDHTHSAATQSAAGMMSAADKSKLDGGVTAGITTAGTGAAYTATVPGITALTAGVSFTMIPNTVSTSTTPTLNVNSLGAKQLRRRLSNMASSQEAGYAASWLASGKPFRVTYDGTYWIVDGMEKPAAADLYGTMGVAKGGTGKTSVTAGNFLVGNGTSAMTEKTPAEVRTAIDAEPSVFRVEFSGSASAGYTMVTDFADVKAANDSGKIVIGYASNNRCKFMLMHCAQSSAVFARINSNIVESLDVWDDGSVDTFSYHMEKIDKIDDLDRDDYLFFTLTADNEVTFKRRNGTDVTSQIVNFIKNA